MRSLFKNKHGNVQMVGVAVATLVAIIIAIMVVYNIAASIDTTGVDTSIQDNIQDAIGDGTGGGKSSVNYSGNATIDTLDQSATFFTIAPLIVVVMVAVIILGYVVSIGGGKYD